MAEENNFLGENFDFIEEGTPFSTSPLEFQNVDELDISESESSKSPWKLIGRVKGCMAPIGTYSRNHRIYEDCHWIKTLKNPNLQERLAGRRIFGMPSHMQKPIDDEDFREGRISHVVSVLEVRNDNNGKPFLYGEFDILDTPAGRILKAMYEGGAGIYVSTRAAGRLKPIPNDPVNRLVDSDSYYLSGIDCVLNPGFLQAKPAFEAMPEVEAKPTLQEGAQTPIPQLQEQPQLNETIAKEQPKQEQSNEEIQLLKGQIDKLTKILEKVVDDVYEAEEQSQEPVKSLEEQLGDLLNNSSITEEAYEDVVAVLKNSNPELTNKIMENSRHKFNDEHGEKSGYKIDYYRFGGSKPYKIVPKDKSYFEASWDSPRYRTLKQAQKHILDTYKKPKEEVTNESSKEISDDEYGFKVARKNALANPNAYEGRYTQKDVKQARKEYMDDIKKKREVTNEALANFVNLMADTNISEKAFEEIVDMISKAKKESK